MIFNVGAATNVIDAIRTHTAQTTGCPTWDTPGIRAALTGCEGNPGAVLAAACLAAEDPSCLKPSVAALRTHWPVNAKSEPPRVPNLDMCPIHPGHERRDCRPCRDDHGPTLDDQARAAAADECRGVIAELQRKVRELRAEREALKAGRS